MLRKFSRDESGAYSIMTVVVMLPILGGLALAIDYSEMSRQRQITLNALDAAGLATARRYQQGGEDSDIKAYAKDFFQANLGPVDPANTTLHVVLPSAVGGGGTLKISADLKYKPYFVPTFRMLLGGEKAAKTENLNFNAKSEVRLKNTLEVALVLDNSGSMDYVGTGSGKKRIDLLKEAAKQLVTTLSDQAYLLKQVSKPLQFGVVPFAASVNVGSDKATASWMDTTGISPIHHENFDWTTMSLLNDPLKYAAKVGSVWYARGLNWGDQKDKPLTRFSIYDKMQRVTKVNTISQCISYRNNGSCRTSVDVVTGYEYDKVASWGGCVESRPAPYNITDEPATTGTPATLFVPMFAPDETGNSDSNSRPANNNWLDDVLTGSGTGKDLARQIYMPKYFKVGTTVTSAYGMDQGPNASCSTKPITPLTDVTTVEGLAAVNAGIDAMSPLGATNVPEGLAWGWRVVSGGAPFTEGRADTENGNDKVVIVLTDGANTYYTPTSVIGQSYSGSNYTLGGNDLAGSKSIYSSYGYLKPYSNGYSDGRLFLGTSGVTKSDFSNSNYTKALNEHFATLCTNAKAKKITLMTVSLDLSSAKTDEKAQMDALAACASPSKFSKNADGSAKKLYFNATGGTLAEEFKKIADELSNLRIIG